MKLLHHLILLFFINYSVSVAVFNNKNIISNYVNNVLVSKKENKSASDRVAVDTNEYLGSTIGLQKGLVDTRNPDILKAQESKDSIIYIDK